MTLFRLKNLALAAGALVLFSGAAMAQVCSIEGIVTGVDGQPVKGAVVSFERTDIKGHYEVKTDKKGHYGHYGLPMGTFNVTVLVDGKVGDKLNGLRLHPGEPTEQNFDLKKTMEQSKALSQAAQNGTLTKDQARSMTAEEKAAFDKQNKEREAALAKNKALSDSFGAGKAALEAKNYDEAITNFNKAAEIDATQPVIFSQLAAAYEGAATAKPSDADALRAKEFDAWQKAIALSPNEAAYHNNYALALGKAKKIPESQAEIEKAAQLDPAGAGKYYYNIGAMLTNSGQTDAACEAFKKAIGTDANYADAQYQYGVCLVGQAKTTPDGKVIPPAGCVEALQKYLELKPDGPNAESAKGLLSMMEGAVQTKYVNPDAKKKKN
jgi:tetratricopeptide (TPR) repeat protein